MRKRSFPTLRIYTMTKQTAHQPGSRRIRQAMNGAKHHGITLRFGIRKRDIPDVEADGAQQPRKGTETHNMSTHTSSSPIAATDGRLEKPSKRTPTCALLQFGLFDVEICHNSIT